MLGHNVHDLGARHEDVRRMKMKKLVWLFLMLSAVAVYADGNPKCVPCGSNGACCVVDPTAK